MATETHELNLPEEVLNLSKTLQKEFTVDETGHIKTDKKLYEKLLPEGLSLEAFELSEKFKSNLFLAANVATGEVGEVALKKNKKLESVHLDKLMVGKNFIESVYHRHYETTKGFGADAEKVTKHGWLTSKFVSKVGSTSTASFSHAREHFAAQGAALFASK